MPTPGGGQTEPHHCFLHLCIWFSPSVLRPALLTPAPTWSGPEGWDLTGLSSLQLHFSRLVSTLPSLWSVVRVCPSQPGHAATAGCTSGLRSRTPHVLIALLLLLAFVLPSLNPPTSSRGTLTLSRVMSGRRAAVSLPSLSRSEMGSDAS